jgi:predicted AAA+ superfamily ATPase
MIHRIPILSETQSFFLFGARGVGKSSLIEEKFKSIPNTLKIDLLKADWEDQLMKSPDSLIEVIKKVKPKLNWVIIDEIQKIPKLLDIVHHLIEEKKIKFAMTGSSSRKLKRGAANMLAGRAFGYEMFPLTHIELNKSFDLMNYLTYGGLPALTHLKKTEDKHNYLRTYVNTYIKEEIQAEQIVRNLKPFRLFLDVAAQMNSKIINYSKIANDINVDTKTVQSYFEILTDTNIGILLQAHDNSLRKRQKKNPKFYYFDTGVARCLDRKLNVPLSEGNFEYGNLFEQFIVLEMHRLNSYFSKDYRFSYLQTNNNLEIDVIIERPGLKNAFVEIKSTRKISDEDAKSLFLIKKDFPDFEYFCLSNDNTEKTIDGVHFLNWKAGLVELGFG